MKNTLYNHTTLITLLIITNLSLIHASNQYQGPAWHTPLVHLYYKSTKENKQDTPTTIKLFENACNNIQTVNAINKQNIKPNMLNKKSLSKKGYDLDTLKVYYLLTQKNKDEHLTNKELKTGNEALENLYYKGTSLDKDQHKSMQEILKPIEDTKIKDNKTIKIDNKPITPHQMYTIQLAQWLNNNYQSSLSSHPTNSHENPTTTNSNNTTIKMNNGQLSISITSPQIPSTKVPFGTGNIFNFSIEDIKDTEKKIINIEKEVNSFNKIPIFTRDNTPEYSSDENNRKIEVNRFKVLSEGNKQKEIKIKNLKYQLKTSQNKLLQKEGEHQVEIKQKEIKIKNLKYQLTTSQNELVQAKKPNQDENSHILNYMICIIIGGFIGIAICQGIHKPKAPTKEELKE